MRILFVLLLVLTSNIANAQFCEDILIGIKSKFEGSNCYKGVVDQLDLRLRLQNVESMTDFCKDCENQLLDKVLENKENKISKRKQFAEFTFREFQKELTFISTDLIKMRSSFPIDAASSHAITSCDIKKNLKKPKCKGMNEDFSKEFDDHVSNIQNALATEIANILQPESVQKTEALFKRIPNACHISDTDAIHAQTRYLESLLTPEFIAELRGLKIPDGKTFKDLNIKDGTTKRNFDDLTLHPLFNRLAQDTTLLNRFINEFKNTDGNLELINRLYSKDFSNNFSTNIDQRCKEVLSKTSKYLEDIYCKENPHLVADSKISIDALANENIYSLKDDDLESRMKLICSDLNTRDKKSISLDTIMKDLNGKNSSLIAETPMYQFKQSIYKQTFNGVAENICAAKDDKSCTPTSNANCAMAYFYKQSQTSSVYKKLAESSNESVNKILRSMIGEGMPQKDGKPDLVAVSLLKYEGILPGDSNSASRTPQDPTTFYKNVKANSTQTPTQAVVPTPKPTQPTSMNSNADYGSSAVPNPSTSNNDDQSSNRATSTTQSANSRTYNPKNPFGSNLSEREQKELLDRMAKAKAAKNSKNNNGSNDPANEDEFQTGGPATLPSSAMGSTQNAQPIDSTRVVNNNNQNQFGNRKTNLDPGKKIDSLNDAKMAANQNRSPSSEGSSTPSGAQVSLSKNAENENEIKIKVPDAELTKVNEFKNKLKDLLNAHGQELSMAKVGEKFVVKLNNYEINVVYNPKLKGYEAICKDASIPKDYLSTISKYFNENLKQGHGKLESLSNAFKG